MTFFETAGQAAAFLLLLYAGLFGGVTYDILSFFRRRVPLVLGMALDILWCFMVAAACGLCLALGGENRVRLFALLGLLCGGGVYCLGVRRAINAVGNLFASRKNPLRRRKSPESNGKGMEK